MIVLALDLATVSGYAIADSEKYDFRTALQCAVKKSPQPTSGVYRNRKDKLGGQAAFLSAHYDWLRDMVAVHAADTVVFEAPFVTGKTHQATARMLLGMAALTEVACYRSGQVSRCHEVDVASVRGHFIGARNVPRKQAKERTIIECEGRGWTVRDDNEADALAVLDYAMHCLVKPRAAA